MRQLTFPCVEPSSIHDPARHRFFLGILPPPDACARIAEVASTLRSEHELFGMPLNQQRLHITVQSLGDYVVPPPAIIELTRTMLDSLHFQPFTARLDLVSSLRGSSLKPRRCAIALRDSSRGPDLQQLQRLIYGRLCTALSGCIPRKAPAFTPHLTMLYDEQNVVEESVAPIQWTVEEVTLVHSRINRGSLQPYSLLAKWPLN